MNTGQRLDLRGPVVALEQARTQTEPAALCAAERKAHQQHLEPNKTTGPKTIDAYFTRASAAVMPASSEEASSRNSPRTGNSLQASVWLVQQTADHANSRMASASLIFASKEAIKKSVLIDLTASEA